MALEVFVKKQLDLINLERDEEIEEARVYQENLPLRELQRQGVCLLKLHITRQFTGLYGRTLVVFECSQAHNNGCLPAHSFSVGVIVGVSPSQSDNSGANQLSGIVSRVTDKLITIAFDAQEDLLILDVEGLYRLNKLANDVTYKRIKKALNSLQSYQPGPASHLIDVLFGEASPSSLTQEVETRKEGKGPTFTFVNDRLDESQREAVTFSLSQREIAVIHGPPGTGKTTTIIEIIQQAIQRNMKVLACAPSNVAVDNLVERLVDSKVRLIRLGHPARAHRRIQKYSLDAILSASEAARIVQDVRKDIDKTQARIAKSRDKDEKRKLRTESKFLRKELKQREMKAMHDILTQADVVLATTTSASRDGPLHNVPKEHFDLVVIDECAQALEASCWIPLQNSGRCILAGDHQQLPPTIKSTKAAKKGLAVSLMERVLSLHGDSVMRMLTTQYRMNDDIMRWSSEQLYEGKLVSHESVAGHLLKDLPHVTETEDTSIALLLVDTAGCDLSELDLPDEISRGNEGEADLIVAHIERLLSSGVRSSEIAVISPYNLQVDLIRLRLASKYPDLEIKSVDGFQGREKEAVVISLVRSNTKGEVGFLAEDRRINVAVTRARRHLGIFCDSETVSHHGFLKSLIDYMNTYGEVRTIFHYQNEISRSDHIPRPDYLDFQKLGSSNKDKSMGGPRNDSDKPKQGTKKHSDQKMKSKDSTKQPGIANISPTGKGTLTAPLAALSEQEIQCKVDDFLKDKSRMTMAFPTSLNSKERFLVHEIAEQLGLHHFSKGDSSDRHVSISKKQSKSSSPMSKVGEDHPAKQPETSINCQLTDNKVARTESMNECMAGPDILSEIVDKVDASSIRYCQYCKKEIDLGSLLLHELQCERIHTRQLKDRQIVVTKKKAKETQKKLVEQLVDDDFDALIAAAIKGDNTCNFIRCKEKIKLIGQLCMFCNRRYCLSHHMPEVHGCGGQAHARARNQLQREKVFVNGSGTKEKKVDPIKKANLLRKLEAKTAGMEAQRHRKSSKKK